MKIRHKGLAGFKAVVIVLNIILAAIIALSVVSVLKNGLTIEMPDDIDWSFEGDILIVSADFVVNNKGYYDIEDISITMGLDDEGGKELGRSTQIIEKVPAGERQEQHVEFRMNMTEAKLLSQDRVMVFSLEVEAFYTSKLVRFAAFFEHQMDWKAPLGSVMIDQNIRSSISSDGLEITLPCSISTNDEIRAQMDFFFEIKEANNILATHFQTVNIGESSSPEEGNEEDEKQSGTKQDEGIQPITTNEEGHQEENPDEGNDGMTRNDFEASIRIPQASMNRFLTENMRLAIDITTNINGSSVKAMTNHQIDWNAIISSMNIIEETISVQYMNPDSSFTFDLDMNLNTEHDTPIIYYINVTNEQDPILNSIIEENAGPGHYFRSINELMNSDATRTMLTRAGKCNITVDMHFGMAQVGILTTIECTNKAPLDGLNIIPGSKGNATVQFMNTLDGGENYQINIEGRNSADQNIAGGSTGFNARPGEFVSKQISLQPNGMEPLSSIKEYHVSITGDSGFGLLMEVAA